MRSCSRRTRSPRRLWRRSSYRSRSAEVRRGRVALASPERGIFEQRLPVHQKRLGGREPRPQAIQDMEAVSIDVAPVVQPAIMQPAHFGEAVEAVSQTENHQAAGNAGEGQAVDLVLRDEDALHG